MSRDSSRDSMPLLDQRLIDAIHLFNHQDWYAAHDAFEELWHEAEGDLRSFLHGMIQVAVAEYHYGNGNLHGATLLMAEGLHHFDSLDFGPGCLPLQPLRQLVMQRLSALHQGLPLSDLPPPQLDAVTPLHP
jgi:hypothetical protein